MDGNYYLAANKPSPPGLTRYILLILALLGFVGMPSAHPAGNHALQSFALSYQPMNFGRPARTVVTVEDKETHDPLLGATVSLVSRADTLRGTTVKEDFYRIMAVYRCDRIFRDSVDLEVTYVGYKPFKKRYGNTGFRGRIEVKMEVDEQSIAQVVVVGQQVAMVFRGDTTVYNAGAFKTMADDRFAELLKQLPGVEIKDNKIYAEGQEVKRVLIDGKNLFGSKTSYALTDLEASDVRSVRVYEDFSPEAKRLGDNTAEKEKVMDVETKSKRGYILGGNLEARSARASKGTTRVGMKSAIPRPEAFTATPKGATGVSKPPTRRTTSGREKASRSTRRRPPRNRPTPRRTIPCAGATRPTYRPPSGSDAAARAARGPRRPNISRPKPMPCATRRAGTNRSRNRFRRRSRTTSTSSGRRRFSGP